jgi:hypothetical protein
MDAMGVGGRRRQRQQRLGAEERIPARILNPFAKQEGEDEEVVAARLRQELGRRGQGAYWSAMRPGY